MSYEDQSSSSMLGHCTFDVTHQMAGSAHLPPSPVLHGVGGHGIGVVDSNNRWSMEEREEMCLSSRRTQTLSKGFNTHTE